MSEEQTNVAAKTVSTNRRFHWETIGILMIVPVIILLSPVVLLLLGVAYFVANRRRDPRP